MPDGSVTKLLQEEAAGVEGARDRLFNRVYSELRAMANRELARERRVDCADGSPTDLAHDAYARLAGEAFVNRKHLFFAYAREMRQVLIRRARRDRTLKRGGRVKPLPLDAADVHPDCSRHLDVIEVDALLKKLEEVEPRSAQVLELKFFGGLSDGVIAEVLGVSERTVRNDLVNARTSLARWTTPER